MMFREYLELGIFDAEVQFSEFLDRLAAATSLPADKRELAGRLAKEYVESLPEFAQPVFRKILSGERRVVL